MFYSKKLKKIKKIKHCFFSRKNGFSKGIYKSLNCGRGSKDDKKNVFKNLNYVAKKMIVEKSKLILMHQIHLLMIKFILILEVLLMISIPILITVNIIMQIE